MSMQRIFWIALLAAFTWSLVMGWEAREYKRKECPKEQANSRQACNKTPPIAALELAKNPQEFRDRIDQGDPAANELWNAEVARVNTCMDFLFVAMYWGVFFFLARMQGKWPSILVTLFISLAASFDIAENVRLLQALHGVKSHKLQFPVPGFVSEAKWVFFAIALLTLGIALAWSKKLWPAVMAILLCVSAGLTAIGIFHLAILSPAVASLFGSLLIAIFYYFPFHPFGWQRLLVWIEFAYLIRFQLIAALSLSVVLPACVFLFPSLFIGIFDALGFRSLVFVVAASLQLAWTVMITSRLVLVYGPTRFPGIAPLRGKPNPPWSTTGLFAGLAAPCIVMTSCGTMALVWWQKLAGVLVGVSIAMALLWLTAKLHFTIESGSRNTARTVFPPFRFLEAKGDTRR